MPLVIHSLRIFSVLQWVYILGVSFVNTIGLNEKTEATVRIADLLQRWAINYSTTYVGYVQHFFSARYRRNVRPAFTVVW